MQEQPGVGGNKVSMGYGKLRGFSINNHLNRYQAAFLPFNSGLKNKLYNIHILYYRYT